MTGLMNEIPEEIIQEVEKGACAEIIQSKIKEIQAVNIPIKFEICGTWIWSTEGEDTKPYKEILKTLKFRWARKKARWYFAGMPKRRKGKSMPMDYIYNKYGSKNIEEESS